jgi:hypothetical protein
MQGTQLMFAESVPGMRINRVRVRLRPWHQCNRECPQSVGSSLSAMSAARSSA